MIKNFIAVVLLILCSNLFAQKNINFDFGYARFNYDSVSAYLELYYSIGQENLTRKIKNDTSFVSALLKINIANKFSGEELVNKIYGVNSQVEAGDDKVIEKNLIGVLGFLLTEGVYKLDISAYDAADSTLKKSYSEEIKVISFTRDNFLLSDIQLANRIITQSANTGSIFYKNTLEVFPNPMNVFGQNYPVLFYYNEIYNLVRDTSAHELVLNTQVINSYGNLVYEKSKEISKSRNSIVEVGVVNLTKYPTGSYTVILNLVDVKTKNGVSSAKRFFVFNPSVEDTQKVGDGNFSVMSSEFGVLSDEECDLLFSASKYIASSNEIERFSKLDSLSAKREFLYNFWRVRDTDQSTKVNEFKKEYDARIKHVEGRFKTFTRKGIKTDRGRIYLMFGEPDEIELHPSDYDKKPYEIWYYHSIEGGVEFVFGDITGYSDYELLHSTKRGELSDQNWVRRIQAN
ncbi:MAG: GWxTD domain-containing protein [Bacteroidetes bacterium]|nr:GWxTD domain-containing protein [Bacteroidota bacterium]MBU2507629.1 GWxTD domain-containing protein [Bacteroidota bacterium]